MTRGTNEEQDTFRWGGVAVCTLMSTRRSRGWIQAASPWTRRAAGHCLHAAAPACMQIGVRAKHEFALLESGPAGAPP